MNVGLMAPSIQQKANIQLSKEKPPEKIYIRAVYKEIADEIITKIQGIQKGGPDADTDLFYQVGGTPQIGKSTMVSYLINCIVRADLGFTRFNIMSFTQAKSGENEGSYKISVLDLAPQRCTATSVDASKDEYNAFGQMRYLGTHQNPDVFQALAAKAPFTSINLLDGLRRLPTSLFGYKYTIAFSSPSFERSNTSDAKWPGSVRYMPVWSKEEMKKYKEMCKDDPFKGEDIDNLYELYSGCIGISTSGSETLEKRSREMYKYATREHVADFKSDVHGALNPNAAKDAKLYEIYYEGEEKAQRWLTKKLRDQIEYTWYLGQATRFLWSSVNKGAIPTMVGYWFEEFVAESWVLRKGISLCVYPENTKTKYVGMEGYEAFILVKFTAPARLVNHAGDDYGVALGTLYRFKPGAPAVDFYCLLPKEDGSDGYRLLLIQVTTAQTHKVLENHLERYINNIESRIQNNDTVRQKIRRLEQEGKEDELAFTRKENSFVEEDEGKEPKMGLGDDNVDIWFLYLQEKKNKSFVGERADFTIYATRSGVQNLRYLVKKVKSLYATGDIVT